MPWCTIIWPFFDAYISSWFVSVHCLPNTYMIRTAKYGSQASPDQFSANHVRRKLWHWTWGANMAATQHSSEVSWRWSFNFLTGGRVQFELFSMHYAPVCSVGSDVHDYFTPKYNKFKPLLWYCYFPFGNTGVSSPTGKRKHKSAGEWQSEYLSVQSCFTLVSLTLPLYLICFLHQRGSFSFTVWSFHSCSGRSTVTWG